MAETEIFNSINFMNYCTCCVKIDDSNCVLTYQKDKDRIYLELIVPSEIREDVEKKLKMCGLTIQ